jgi:hypothetical protein
VTLIVDGTAVASQQLTGGATSYSLTSPTLTDGSHSVKIRVSPNSSSTIFSYDSIATGVTIDTVSPATGPATFSLKNTSDSGVSNTDRITNASTLTFNIPIHPNGLRMALFDGTTRLQPWANQSVTIWPYASGADGIYNFNLRWGDDAGNYSPPSPFEVITVDKTAAAAPSIADLLQSSDSGMSDSDNITNDATPTLQLNSAATYYRLYRDATLVSASYASIATAPQYTAPTLANGTYAYTLYAVDAAGNVSAASPSLSVTIDTIAPTGHFVAVAPDPRTTAVDYVDAVFSEALWSLGPWFLKRNGSNVLNGSETLTQIDTTTWRFGNLTGVTGASGTYQIGLQGPIIIRDIAGNTLGSFGTESWVRT